MTVQFQRFTHGLVLALTLRRTGDARHAVPEQFLAAVAGQRAAGVVDRQHAVVIVHDHHAFAGRLEHRRCQALLFGLAAQLADVATGADHAQGTASGVTLDHPAAILEPDFAAVGAQCTVFDGELFGFALQVRDQDRAHAVQILGVDVRQRRAILVVAVLPADAEDHFQTGMVNMVVLQIPVPQPEAAGVQRQIQPRLALAQLFGKLGEFCGALGDALLEAIVGTAQLLFGMATLLDFRGQTAIELVGFAAGGFQPLDQLLLMQPLFEPVVHQPADLPADQAEGGQHDHRQQTPALLQRMAAGHQQKAGRQQTGHGETEEGGQADPVSDAGGHDDRTDQPIKQRLGNKDISRHQHDHGVAQAQRRRATAEQKAPAPARRGLRLGAGSVEGEYLLQAQQCQRAHPAQPQPELDTALLAPEHHAENQCRQQQQPGRYARTSIQQPGTLGNDIGRRRPAGQWLC